MAGIMDMINQGIGGLNTPLGMLGMQLMANSGYDPHATGASRLGNALVGVGQQQAQMQQLQLQQQLRQQQAQEVALRGQALKQQQTQRDALSSAMQNNPDLAKGLGPLGAAVIQAGGDPADAAAFGKLQNSAGPQMAKMPWTRERPNEDGTTTHMEYDLQTGGYKPVSTYKTPTMINAEQNVAKTAQQLEYTPKNYELAANRSEATTQNAQTAQERLALEQAKQAKEFEAAAFKKNYTRMEFKQQSRAAIAQIDDTAKLVDDIVADPAFNSLYGPNGYIPPVAGSAAADLQAKIDRLNSIGGLTEITNLKDRGVSLAPTTDNDMRNARASFANYDKIQSDKAAMAEFKRTQQVLQRMRTEAQTRVTELDSLFDTPAAQATSTVPAVGAVMDGYQYNGGDPASPSSWSKK